MLDLSDYDSSLFADTYRRLMGSLSGVEEPQIEPYGVVGEDVVRGIWFGGHHKRILATEDGRRLEVMSPGGWNVEAGPDFRHAELMVEQQGIVRGDVEVHVLASDWARHGHDKNPAYDAVALHVCLRNDTPHEYATNSQGQRVPQLALENRLTSDLAELQEALAQQDYPAGADTDAGLCRKHRHDRGAGSDWLGKLLDFAGDERMLGKARRFESALQAKPFDQVLYEGLMEGLGYKSNAAPCLQLARLAPLDYLRRRTEGAEAGAARAEAVQAALFGVAALLPSPDLDTDEETRDYVARLHGHWASMKGDFKRQIMDAHVWQFSGCRPINYPPRRIAAMGCLVAQHAATGLGQAMLRCFEAGAGANGSRQRARAVLKEVSAVFAACTDPYWDTRYQFAGKRLAAPRRLVGDDRCAILVVNVLVPILLQYARQHATPELEERVHAVFTHCRKLAADSITRFMARRILATDEERRRCITGARRQQGLHQIYQDFCKRDDLDCTQCLLVLAMDAAPRMPAASR